ncbi:hypothetical protein CC80DRAFT_572663, partial [Byssothecium circinans]
HLFVRFVFERRQQRVRFRHISQLQKPVPLHPSSQYLNLLNKLHSVTEPLFPKPLAFHQHQLSRYTLPPIMSLTIPALLHRAVTTTTPPQSTPSLKTIDITVGPIPLPAFICLIFFGPFFLGFIFWVFYLFTYKRFVDKRQLARQGTQEDQSGKVDDIENQVQQFIGSANRNGRRFETREARLKKVRVAV